jgi:FkbM family methyltransferase
VQPYLGGERKSLVAKASGLLSRAHRAVCLDKSRPPKPRLELRTPRSRVDNTGRMSLKLKYLYRAYRYRFRVDPAELKFVSRSLQRGQVAADIGCHKGAYTYWMRRRVGPTGAVFAFEPQPRQVKYLREAFSAMGYDNVEVVPMAVSDQCRSKPLHVPVGLGKSHMASLEDSGTLREMSGAYSVEATTLDAFFSERSQGPNFLKIDVEGHELAVLNGATQVLEKFRPTILIECEARHRPDGDVRPVFELLDSQGYEGTFFLNRVRLPLADFDQSVHQHLEDPNPVFLPAGYVNNFAFVPRNS